MIYILACDQLLVIILHCFNAFQSQIEVYSLVQVETIIKTETSRDSDSSGEGTGRGKETDGGFFMYIFCFFFKTWRGE